MANFHTNLFVVAANEQDMLKVLKLSARNFAACADTTQFSLENFEQYGSVSALYRQLKGYFEGWYEYALSGVSGGTATGAVTWGVNELGRKALSGGSERLASYYRNRTGNPDLEISVVNAPTARPLSDSADVRLDEYAGTFVLSLGYSTAWEPNSGDVDAFFTLLEAGDYGVAFLDADEGDSYSEVSTFNGLHHGGRTLRDLDSSQIDECRNAGDLEEDAKKYVLIDREDIHDPVELAYAVAVCRWPEYDSPRYISLMDEYYDNLDEDQEDNYDEWYEENYPDDINYEEGYEECRLGGQRAGQGTGTIFDGPFESGGSAFLSARSHEQSSSPLEAKRINWITPQEADLRRIAACLAEVVLRLPVHAMLDDESHEVNQDAIASALAGDEVRITSVWNKSRSVAPVDLMVEGLDGTLFGHLGGDEALGYRGAEHLWSKIGPFERMANWSATIACLLPHLTVRVDKAMPIALRSGHAKHSIFIARIELADRAYERIEEDALALLSLPYGERGASSLVKRG